MDEEENFWTRKYNRWTRLMTRFVAKRRFRRFSENFTEKLYNHEYSVTEVERMVAHSVTAFGAPFTGRHLNPEQKAIAVRWIREQGGRWLPQSWPAGGIHDRSTHRPIH